MGELANCAKCGKVYVKTGIRELCYDCFREEEEAFEKVRRFINKRDNRTASMKEISEGTGVPEELILKFIKQGRLNIARLPNVGYPCETCGRIIRVGRICEQCARRISKELEALKEKEKREREREKKETYYAIDKRYRDGGE